MQLLTQRMGIPPGAMPALTFDVTPTPDRMESTPALEWMTFPCLPAVLVRKPSADAIVSQFGWMASLRMTDPGLRLRYLHLGAWLDGGFQIPIHTPTRMLPGRCPLASFLDGTFEAHFVDTYRLVLIRP